MQHFKYKGYDSTGSVVEGQVAGESIDEAERRIAGQDVTIISIIPAGFSKKAAAAASAEGGEIVVRKGKKVPNADVAVILRDMAVMAETGVPFVEALDALVSSARTPAISEGLKQLRTQIVGGKGL